MNDLTGLDYFNNEVKKEMEAFSAFFNQKITQEKNDLLVNRDKYINLVDELSKQKHELENQLETVNKRHTDLEKQRNVEVQELATGKLKVEELELQQRQYEDAKLELTRKIEELNKSVEQKRHDLSHISDKLVDDRRLSLLQLNKFTTYLGLKIEGLKPDLLKFNFNNIDMNDYDKVVSFKLDLSGEEYKITETVPLLKIEDVTKIEKNFNNHKDLGKFLKNMRDEFVKV